MKKERDRFSRRACGSSRGNYVRISHEAYIKEQHAKNKEIVAQISLTIEIKPKYYAKCFGHLIRVTEVQAKMLGEDSIVIKY